MDFSPACLMCGYSLVGLPDGRCPECGGEFSHAGLIAHRDEVDRKRDERGRVVLGGVLALGTFMFLAFAFLPPTAQRESFKYILWWSVAVSGCVWLLCIRPIAVAWLISGLIAVALPVLALGIAISAQSITRYRAGYQWTDFDIPARSGWRWLDPATGCILGPSLIAIALAIPAGLWLLKQRLVASNHVEVIDPTDRQ